MSTKLIDLCLSSPSAVLRAWKDLASMGYDTDTLMLQDLNDSKVLELRDKALSDIAIEVPATASNPVIKYAD